MTPDPRMASLVHEVHEPGRCHDFSLVWAHVHTWPCAGVSCLPAAKNERGRVTYSPCVPLTRGSPPLSLCPKVHSWFSLFPPFPPTVPLLQRKSRKVGSPPTPVPVPGPEPPPLLPPSLHDSRCHSCWGQGGDSQAWGAGSGGTGCREAGRGPSGLGARGRSWVAGRQMEAVSLEVKSRAECRA